MSVNILKSLLGRLKTRRKYRRNFPIFFSHSVSYSVKMASDYNDNSKLYLPESDKNELFLSRLSLASKSGTWFPLPLVNKSVWTSRYRVYFKLNLRNGCLSQKPQGGIANDIKSFKVLQFTDVYYYPNYLPSNGLNMFTFRLKRGGRLKYRSKRIHSAIAVEVGGADSFQHFVQDCLPLLSYLSNEEIIPKGAKVLLKNPMSSQSAIYFLLNSLFPQLDFYFPEENSSLSIENLFVPHFYPRNYVWSLPRPMFSSMNSLIRSKFNSEIVPNKIVFLHRGKNRMRNLANPEYFRDHLSEFAASQSLDLAWIDTSSTNISDISRIVGEARVVLGLHGGNMYNLIFAPKDCLVVELVPSRNLDSVANLAIALGYQYLPIPLNYDKSDGEVAIPLSEFGVMVDVIKNTLKV